MTFIKGSEKREIETESEVWNLAPHFTTLKILKPLYECDRLEILSMYGTENVDDVIPEQIRTQKRIDAIKRLRTTLRMLIHNSLFILKGKDQEEIIGYLKTLDSIEPFYKTIYRLEKPKHNQSEVVVIDEINFGKILNILLEIKTNVNTPLNNANLIFRSTEGVDIDDISEDFISGD